MANTLIITFEPCEPPPDIGYEVIYRPKGDLGAYRVWPFLFQTSPAVFTDTNDPEGTEYEGFIRGVCTSGRGIDIPWDTGDPSDVDDSPGDESPEDCGGFGRVVVVNHLPGGTVTAVEGIAGFSAIPPNLLTGNTRMGTHTAFTGVVQFTVSGSGANGNAVLFRNEILVGCVNISDPGAFFFPSDTFEACDEILLILTDGDCM
jgi:hypothetical protein